jgi:DNA invertase Pin-like site-specific DNA recombinase
VVEEFVRSDAEVSGSSLANREALDSLVSDARKRPRSFDCLMIDDTSRLGRNLTDVLKISDILKYNEVSLYFVSHNACVGSRNQGYGSRHRSKKDEEAAEGTMDMGRGSSASTSDG